MGKQQDSLVYCFDNEATNKAPLFKILLFRILKTGFLIMIFSQIRNKVPDLGIRVLLETSCLMWDKSDWNGRLAGYRLINQPFNARKCETPRWLTGGFSLLSYEDYILI